MILTFLVVIVVGCSATPKQSAWWKCALASAAVGAAGVAPRLTERLPHGAQWEWGWFYLCLEWRERVEESWLLS